MNAFLLHHQDSIRFSYSCFDRILLNAVVQVLQQPPSVVWFLREKRNAPAITRNLFRSISTEYHQWVDDLAEQRGIPIVEPPRDVRREEWVEPHFQKLRPDNGIAVVLKSRENARVAVANACGHVEMLPRFGRQYYFYIQDRDFGRMFLRVRPYFPFNARLCLNGHEWLACRLREEGIRFQQCANGFLNCSAPDRLQELSDGFSPAHVLACAHRWLAQLVPFFSDAERRREGFGHRLFVSQVEYCTNLIFHRRAALDRTMERLSDLNRTIGRPDKLSVIFGRRITKRTVDGVRTQITDHHLGNPVIRSDYKSGSVKQYVRDHLMLRTETTSYNTRELGVAKGIENLGELRETLKPINERYLDVQQDVLETFVDRGQLDWLRQPTVTAAGRRTPGLRLDDPRLSAVMQALVAFCHIARGWLFRTADLHRRAAEALGRSVETYTLGQLRYDLSKLRAKGLVEKVKGTQDYRLTPEGGRICILYLKLFHRIYAPLTAGALEPVPGDAGLSPERRCRLDRLYAAVDRALNDLFDDVGVKLAG